MEISLFIAIIAAASIAVALVANVNFLDSVFHVVSLASTAGSAYLSVSALNANAVSILLTVMVIGGCAFSMAGGIKVSRLLTLATSVGQQVKMTFTKSPKKSKEKTSVLTEAFPAIASILLFIATLVVFALIFSTIGVSFNDALFEVGSALSTTGVSMGATSIAMPFAYKWLMIVAMIIGKVEILTILVLLVPFSVKKLKLKR